MRDTNNRYGLYVLVIVSKEEKRTEGNGKEWEGKGDEGNIVVMIPTEN